MISFEKDRAGCLAQYLRQAPCAPLEDLRDTLYQAYLRLKTQDPAQARLGNALLEQAAWGPCPYSGLPAVQLLTECADALSEKARTGLLDFLRAGRSGWLAELERNKCNSFRLLAAVSLLGCGLLLDDQDAGAAGRAALVWMEDHLAAVDLPDEFLSPFYTALQLAALAEIRLLPVGADCAGRAGRLEAFLWRGVLRHYQPGLTELAGPYSRGYTSELAGHFQIIMACIYRLLGQEAGFTFRDTLWDPAYSAAILPHGSLENMRYYALYFSGFPYRCDPEDLEALRREQSLEEVAAYVERYGSRLTLPDQDILSALYGERTLLLDTMRYNLSDRILGLYNMSHRPEERRLVDWVRANGVIIHYCGRNKPWKENYLGILDVFYREVAEA